MRSPRPGPSAPGRLGAAPLAARLALRWALGAAVVAAAGPLACASSPGTAAAPARRNAAERPPPFASAPDFSVPDASGAARDLASLMGPRGLVLVLYRGHW